MTPAPRMTMTLRERRVLPHSFGSYWLMLLYGNTTEAGIQKDGRNREERARKKRERMGEKDRTSTLTQ